MIHQRAALTLCLIVTCLLGSASVARSASFTFAFPGDVGGGLVGPFGTNDLGDTAGFFSDATGFHGFLLDASGNLTVLDAPGATSTQAYEVNNNREVVGSFSDPTGTHGFLWDAGENPAFTAIDITGASATVAYGINDTGHIVGAFTDDMGTHGFLLEPYGEVSVLDAPDADFTQALRIDNDGVITGISNSPSGSDFTATPIPEPASLLLLASGLAGLGLWNGKRRRSVS